MKSIMSMQALLDPYGLNLTESFGVVTAMDNMNPEWTMEADLSDPEAVEALRSHVWAERQKRVENYVKKPTTRRREMFELDCLLDGRSYRGQF